MNPRREKSPAILVSTPGLFSIVIDKVFFISPSSKIMAGLSLRHHGKDVFLLLHDEVQNEGGVGFNRSAYGRQHVLGFFYPGGLSPVSPRQLDEIRADTSVEIRVGVALVIEKLLPLPHHP